jgi:hypothetical protein
MSYRRVGVIGQSHNLRVNLVKRQHAAATFVQNLSSNKTIVSIDESVLRSTDHRRYSWVKRGKAVIETTRQTLVSTNIIGAVSSDGNVYFTVNRGRTNSLTFTYFLSKLITHLDAESPSWRETTVMMMDNASYHRSKMTRAFLSRNRVPYTYLGPY